MPWQFWWQRSQQLLGALAALLLAAGFLDVLAGDTLPGQDFEHDIPIRKLDHRTVDHVHVATAVGSCHTTAPVSAWPHEWLDTLRLTPAMLQVVTNAQSEWRDVARTPAEGVEPATAHSRAPAYPADPSTAVTGDMRDERLTSFERAAIYHSDRILQEREHYLEKAERRQDRARRNQLRVLLLSAAGAFLVGMTTLLTDKNTDAPFRSLTRGAMLPISALALLMPLLSTAMSGLVAFDDDGKILLRDLRTVAQLEQLHGRLAEDVTSEPFRCQIIEATGKLERGLPLQVEDNRTLTACVLDKMEQTRAWEQRHEQILNDATQTLARAGDLARPGDGAKDKEPAKAQDNPCRAAFDHRAQSAGGQPTTVGQPATAGQPKRS